MEKVSFERGVEAIEEVMDGESDDEEDDELMR